MPIWVLVLDYVMGMIMWTLIGRTAMNVFQREDSEFFFMRMFVKLTNPVIKPFAIAPSAISRDSTSLRPMGFSIQKSFPALMAAMAIS